MESAGVSGTVTISDQRSYIALHSKNLTEIHGALREVCGELIVDHSMVSCWANHFRDGYVSIDNDPRLGRSKTSTDETSVKLVADALEVDQRVTCEELPRVTGVPATSVLRILTNDLMKRKIFGR